MPRVTCHLPVRTLYETEAQDPRRQSTANNFAKTTDEAPRQLAPGGGLGVPGSHLPCADTRTPCACALRHHSCLFDTQKRRSAEQYNSERVWPARSQTRLARSTSLHNTSSAATGHVPGTQIEQNRLFAAARSIRLIRLIRLIRSIRSIRSPTSRPTPRSTSSPTPRRS